MLWRQPVSTWTHVHVLILLPLVRIIITDNNIHNTFVMGAIINVLCNDFLYSVFTAADSVRAIDGVIGARYALQPLTTNLFHEIYQWKEHKRIERKESLADALSPFLFIYYDIFIHTLYSSTWMNWWCNFSCIAICPCLYSTVACNARTTFNVFIIRHRVSNSSTSSAHYRGLKSGINNFIIIIVISIYPTQFLLADHPTATHINVE